ncbi:MAG: biopolymer transporter ExbD [Burkholderiales bacterium]|nr:biopolymer transporter ExbD [Burkholderiales bacterium]MDE2432363.1 biopolymer transporter ExbD [Burkholderiales bacterium]
MRYFEHKRARIEIIPMIDIMFFMLVFFILISLHMIPSSGLVSNLPDSSTASVLPTANVVVTVDAKGSISVDGNAKTPVQLTELLRVKDAAHTVVTIAGSKETSLQSLMAVMDACRTAGITKIGLAAKQQPQP